MRLIILAVAAAVLIEGYLSASVHRPAEDSKNVVRRQAPSLPSFMPPHMGGFLPNMGAMGASGMGDMRPGMGDMGPPFTGGMGLPYMPPNMFRPPNFPDAASNSNDGQSFGFGSSFSNNTDGYSWVASDVNGNITQYHGNRTSNHS